MSVYVIAEIGVNHNGQVELAKQMIDKAVAAGANAVKFQTFKADRIISRFAKKADYQVTNTGNNESQLDMVKKLELTEDDHLKLFEYANSLEVDFLSSPFDNHDIRFLQQLGVKKLKIPSGEIVNAPFLVEAGLTGLPIILSTGMCNIGEVDRALKLLSYVDKYQRSPESIDELYANASQIPVAASLPDKLTLLHCTTEYPCPFAEVNLRVLDTYQQQFGLPIGYSDHTPGIEVAIAAVAKGATIIEKHFTLSKTMEGPDHRASLEPSELRQLVQSIRHVELALGSGEKQPTESERRNMQVARKSLVALSNIQEGEILSPDNLGMKRPGTGVSPFDYWSYLGKTANRNYQPDESIDRL